MSTSSVKFAFRDRITFVLNDRAAKALRNEVDYRDCCSLPKLTEFLGLTTVQMNTELQTLVGRGYVTVQDEIVFPTWKTLIKHQAFQGISLEEGQAILARLLQPADRS
jgi:hypothetical protein